MKKFLLLICLLLSFSAIIAQSMSSSPSVGTFTNCTNALNQTCSFGTVYSNSYIKARVTSINSNTATVQFYTCSGNGTYAGDMYIKSSVCSSFPITSKSFSYGSSNQSVTFNHGLSVGQSMTFYVTLTVNNNGSPIRVYAQPITITKSAAPPPPSLQLAQPIGFSQYSSGLAQGTKVNTDLLIQNTGGTFQGSLYVSLHDNNGNYVMDLGTWNNITIAQNSTYQASLKTSPTITQAIGNGYRIYAKYIESNSSSYHTIPTGNCNCSNPFYINIYDPISCSSSPSTSPTVITQGSAATFYGFVNNASSHTYNKDLKLMWRNNSGVGIPLTTYTGNISGYSNKTISAYSSSITSSPGTYYLRVEDANQKVYCSKTVTVVAPSPNLSCTSSNFTVSPNPLVQGQSGYLAGSISNTGNGAFNGSLVLIWEKGSQYHPLDTFTGTINAGSSKLLSVNSNPVISSPGTWTLSIRNLNNQNIVYCSKSYTVLAAPTPNLTCNSSNFTVSPNPLIQNQSGYLAGSITNNGNAAFNDGLDLVWEENVSGGGYYTLDEHINSVPAGGSVTLSVTSNPIISSPGTWTLSIKNRSDHNIVYCSKTVTVNAPTCGGCTAWTNPPLIGSDACIATSYLCQNGDIQANQDGTFNANSAISRKDLASVQYNMKFNGAAYSDYFPHKYTDIDKNAIYYKAVMAMSYLEYGDGISPFDRDANFDPDEAIYRKYGVKVILETFDIKPDSTLSCPFTDVSTSDDMYGYIAKAYQLGIIDNNTSFSPTSNLTREDAFIWLYRTKYVLGINPTVTNSDFKIPRNITIESYRQRIGEEKGGFTMHSEPIFSLLGHTPLSLFFFYDVTKTKGDTYRDSYFQKHTNSSLGRYHFEPLGKGWSHNFNSYVIRQGVINQRLIVRGGDGNFTSFKYVTGTTFEPETKDVYEELTTTTNGYDLKFKNQIIYHYKYLQGNLQAAYLDKITDRFGNQITFTYEASSALVHRLKKVEDPYGRYLEFLYTSGNPHLITEVKCVAGSIIRSAYINYKDNDENLWKYMNASGKVMEFDYFTSDEKKYLMKSIKYPKGNYVYHSFDNNRRFYRSGINPNLGTDYDISVSLNESYTSSGRTVTSVTTMRPTNGSTQSHVVTSVYNDLGQAISSSDNLNTHNIVGEYNDAQNPYLPTKVINLLANTYTTYTYDQSNTLKRGNLLNMQFYKNGVLRLETSSTYTNLNDVATYTDVGNVTTTNTYLNGFLTKVSRNGIEVIYTPHSSGNGAISSITSSGTTANLGYNNYFNLNSISIAGTSMNATTTYDDASRWIQKNGFNGRIDKITNYDAMDNPTSGINDFGGLNHNWSRVIDDNQNEAAFTYEGQTRSWGFDPVTDELISETFGGLSKTYSYHLDGRLNTATNKNGHTFQQDYWNGGFKDGLLKDNGYAQFNYAQSAIVYLQTITKNGLPITFGLDDLYRTNKVTYDNMTVSHGFNNYGQITSDTLPNGNIVEKDRNLNGRIYNTKYNGLEIGNSTYDIATGRKTKTIYKNGNTTIFQKKFFYQANTDWLDSMVYVQPNGNVLYYEAYQHDSNGNHIGKRTKNIPLAAPAPAFGTYTLTPDATNRLGIDNGTTVTNNNNGVQLGGTITVNSVDELDNILNATIDGFSLSVDVDGLELARRINNTKYVYDILSGNQIIMETDLSNNPLWINIWNDGEIVCRIDAQNNIKYYPVATYNGSVRMWIDETGTITHQYNYLDDFGTVLNKQEAFPMPYQYQGIYGAQTLTDNLVKMNARYYVPSQRRFISSDPIAAVNGYLFAGGNPMMNIDPSGESYWDAAKKRYDQADLIFDFTKNLSKTAKVGSIIAFYYADLGNMTYKGINGENPIADVIATTGGFTLELLIIGGKLGGRFVAAAPLVVAEGVMVLAGRPEESDIYYLGAALGDYISEEYINNFVKKRDVLPENIKKRVRYGNNRYYETDGFPYKAAPIQFISPSAGNGGGGGGGGSW